jgi:hypothetical protein
MKYNHPTEIPRSNWLFFEWLGERIPVGSVNVKGDTHPMTWADDGDIYMGTGDPCWMVRDGYNYVADMSRGFWKESRTTYEAMSGQVVEKITEGPERFEVHRVHDMPGYTGPGGGGPKPCGMICVEGKLYYAVQNLLGWKTPPRRPNSQHGSDATIICSEDKGKTWTPELNALFADFTKEQYDYDKGIPTGWLTTEEERTGFRGWKPMFPGGDFGGPTFIQFGKNNDQAVDGYVYAVSGDQWDNGNCLRLGRAPAGAILEASEWEFVSVDEKYNPVWRKNLSDSKPILEIDGHISIPEMVYISHLKKYILLTWALHTDFRTPTGSELTILESDKPWGPFYLVHYDWMWYKRACCAYNPRLPLKWYNQETLEGYILHSGNWESQVPYYMPQIRKFRFTVRDDDCRRPLLELLNG